jgi:hypothetical protein
VKNGTADRSDGLYALYVEWFKVVRSFAEFVFPSEMLLKAESCVPTLLA